METVNKMPQQPGGLSKEQETEHLINEISSIASQLNVMWKYHPKNPKGVDFLEQYSILENYLKASKENYDKLNS